MVTPIELTSVLTDDEAWDIMRSDMFVLLSQDPHSPLANLIGQALADLQER